MTRPSIYSISIPDLSSVVSFLGMHRKVNSAITQLCSITCLVNEPQNAYSIGVGIWITTTYACICCRTDVVANLMTNEKPDLGPQTRICSIKPGK